MKEPLVEGAEKEDAHLVAHCVGRAEQDQETAAEDAGEIQTAENEIESDPCQGQVESVAVHLVFGKWFVRGDVVARQMFLAARTHKPCREEAYHYLRDEHHPHRRKQDRQPLERLHELGTVTDI